VLFSVVCVFLCVVSYCNITANGYNPICSSALVSERIIPTERPPIVGEIVIIIIIIIAVEKPQQKEDSYMCVKVKVKSSLRLINQAPRHEDGHEVHDSWPRHWMQRCDQPHAPDALLLGTGTSPLPTPGTHWTAGPVWTTWRGERSLAHARTRNPAVQPVSCSIPTELPRLLKAL
jgi:hypothetical protein